MFGNKAVTGNGAETRERTFGSTMTTLERAYSAMLHEAFDYTVTSGIAQRVRELADNIRWKLHAHVPDHEQEGWSILKEMLEHGRE